MQALEKYNIEKDIAAFIKKEFDRKYNPTWHCIVGRNFGETLFSQCCTGFWQPQLEIAVRSSHAAAVACIAVPMSRNPTWLHHGGISQVAHCKSSHASVVALHCGGSKNSSYGATGLPHIAGW